jgi:hypothetical protein
MQVVSLIHSEELIENPQYKCSRSRVSDDLEYLLFTFESDQAYCNGWMILQYLSKVTWLPPIQFNDKNNLYIVADMGDPLSLVEKNPEYLRFMLDQFSAQLADLHRNGIVHGAISSDTLYFNEAYCVGTLFGFSDSVFTADKSMFIEDWKALLDILQRFDITHRFRDEFQQAEKMLTLNSSSEQIADIFHDEKETSEIRRSKMYSNYKFLCNCDLEMPITDPGRLVEYILFHYIRRLMLSNGYVIDDNVENVIGRSAKVIFIEGVTSSKISSHAFGWIWLKGRLEQLRIANPDIFRISNWAWDRTGKIEMNFRSNMRISNQNDVVDSNYFPFSSEFHAYKFVDDHGSIRLLKVEDLSQIIPREQNNIQAFVEFYAQDSLTTEASNIDFHILEKLLQIIKSITIGLAEEFYRRENYNSNRTAQEELWKPK